MAELLLHIGGEKTGTTSLQAFLAKNSRLLMERYGILYPVSGPLSLNDGHFPVVSAFLEPEKCAFVPPAKRLTPAAVSEALTDLCRKRQPRLVVLSAEHFSSRLEKPSIRSLAQAIPLPRTRIMFYVRRQSDLAVSSFSSALRSGVRWWLTADRVAPGNRFFNHLAVADDWADIFGPANVELRAFDRLRAGIEQDFLSAIGVDPTSDFQPVKPRKEKISLEEARLLHALNRHIPNWLDAVSNNEPESFYKAQRLRERVLLLSGQELTQRTALDVLLPPAVRDSIRSRFADVNRELAERYGVEIPDGNVRPNETAADIAPDDQVDLFARVLARCGYDVLDLEQRVAALEARTLKGRARAAKAAAKRLLGRD